MTQPRKTVTSPRKGFPGAGLRQVSPGRAAFGRILMIPVLLFLLILRPSPAKGFSSSEYAKFQSGIEDYRNRLNKRYRKVVRKQTRYIIVHTSELGLSATLRVVSQGKRFKSGRTTPGGHAHYVIARNGRTYRILDKRFRADHAGRSMWQRKPDISAVSIGIELVGYHYAPLTDRQYRSLAMLIDILQNYYGLKDRAVLTHSQVAYGGPNRWFPKNHRGRKRCAKNLDRSRAGLGPTVSFDPDVRAGRLMADPQLDRLFYGRQQAEPVSQASNIVSKSNSAWSIAGEDYNQSGTAYVLPGGQVLPGDKIASIIGWQRLPAGTRVLLNQETAVPETGKPVSPVKTITDSMTAWSHAGPSYRSDTTIYFLPSGQTYAGSRISDWDDLPVKTRLIVGYKGPYSVSRTQTAYKIAGRKYRDAKTVYFLPPNRLITGDKMSDFNQLPKGTRIYLPAPG